MNGSRALSVFLAGAFLLAGSARGSAYVALFSGDQEASPTGSLADGIIYATVSGDLLQVNLIYSGLDDGNRGSDFYCCASPGTNGAVAIPFVPFVDPTENNGSYRHTFDLTDSTVYSPPFLAANGGSAASAEAALLAGLDSGMAYANIYTAAFPNGEIRADLVYLSEPATFGLSGLALAGLFALKRRISA